MDDQREGHGPGRARAALKETKTPKENVRSLAVVLLALIELLGVGDDDDGPGASVLANARELVRRTQ